MGLSIQKRNGHDATEMRSRGVVGKAMCGPPGAACNLPPRIFNPGAAAHAATAIPTELLRNRRRERGFMRFSGTEMLARKQYFTAASEAVARNQQECLPRMVDAFLLKC